MILVAKISHYLQEFKKEAGNIVSGLFFFVFFRVYLAIFAAINAALWLSSYIATARINETRIALHYNIESGIDYYGSSELIYVLPTLGALAFLINTVVFAIVRNHPDRKFIGHTLFLFALLTNFILLIGIYLIYIINFK